MNKVLTTLFILFVYVYSYSQHKLGYTFFEVMNDKYNTYLIYKTDPLCVYTETPDGIIMHFFNNDKICIYSSFIPISRFTLNKYVTIYNENYSHPSDRMWIEKYKKLNVIIELKFEEDLDYFFNYYIEHK